MEMNEVNTYRDLKGIEFLSAYFRDHGLSEEEIDLMASWGYFAWCSDLRGDKRGIEYADLATEKMKHYRGLSADYVNEHPSEAPWYWPTAMRFYRVNWTPKDKISGVMECIYQGKSYLFGIGKEEVTITEDMYTNGEWSVYTYSD